MLSIGIAHSNPIFSPNASLRTRLSSETVEQSRATRVFGDTGGEWQVVLSP